jgi:SAM-dependent methyltransferase
VFGSDRILLDYVIACGELLAPILTGRVSALETLFPGGSFQRAEDLYERAPLSAYYSALSRAAVEGLLLSRAGRRLRLLEIGAGTGGTTAAVLPCLPPDRTEYHFTDVSDLFLLKAEEKFRHYPFLRYGKLDIEQAPSAFGFAAASFDVVLATNVIHAVRNLDKALARARSLLAPGGVLVLCEVTSYLPWFDVTTGLIEGWQAFDDQWRGDHPLLPAERWQRALIAAGFERTAAYPELSCPASILGQHVVLAQVEGSFRETVFDEVDASRPSADAVPLRSDFGDRLRSQTEMERREALVNIVSREIAAVLRIKDPDHLERRRRLVDLGLDSLMALELRKRLSNALGLERPLPATLVYDHPHIEAVADFLNREHFCDQQPALTAAPAPEAPENIQDLSDAEAESRLLEKLKALRTVT